MTDGESYPAPSFSLFFNPVYEVLDQAGHPHQYPGVVLTSRRAQIRWMFRLGA